MPIIFDKVVAGAKALTKSLLTVHESTETVRAANQKIAKEEKERADEMIKAAAQLKAVSKLEKEQNQIIKEHDILLRKHEASMRTGIAVDDAAEEQLVAMNKTIEYFHDEIKAATKALDGNNDSVATMTASIEKQKKENKSHADHLEKVSGPLAKYVSLIHRHREASHEASDAVEKLPPELQALGRASMKLAGAAAIATGVIGLGRAVVELTKKTHLDYNDAARQSVRGTILMGDTMVQAQHDITTASKDVQAATGDTLDAAVKFASGWQENMRLADQPIDVKSLTEFATETARVGRVTGLGAEQLGEFNRRMMTTMHQTPAMTTAIDDMLDDSTNKFGMSGAKAMEKVNEHLDDLQGISAGDRADFINGLLTASGRMEQAGVNFEKYTKSLSSAQGTDAVTSAAALASLTGHRIDEIEQLMLRSDAGDKQSGMKLAQLQVEGVAKGIGMTPEAMEQHIKDRSEMLSMNPEKMTPEQQRKAAKASTDEYNIQMRAGSGGTGIMGLLKMSTTKDMYAADQAAREVHLNPAEVAPNKVKPEDLQHNIKTDERANQLMGSLASSLDGAAKATEDLSRNIVAMTTAYQATVGPFVKYVADTILGVAALSGIARVVSGMTTVASKVVSTGAKVAEVAVNAGSKVAAISTAAATAIGGTEIGMGIGGAGATVAGAGLAAGATVAGGLAVAGLAGYGAYRGTKALLDTDTGTRAMDSMSGLNAANERGKETDPRMLAIQSHTSDQGLQFYEKTALRMQLGQEGIHLSGPSKNVAGTAAQIQQMLDAGDITGLHNLHQQFEQRSDMTTVTSSMPAHSDINQLNDQSEPIVPSKVTGNVPDVAGVESASRSNDVASAGQSETTRDLLQKQNQLLGQLVGTATDQLDALHARTMVRATV
jgi:archaellum component FlaC